VMSIVSDILCFVQTSQYKLHEKQSLKYHLTNSNQCQNTHTSRGDTAAAAHRST
jgi:hypothetical protein